MITLLVAFFIMLYAMSVMNQAKFQQLAISVRSGFGGSIDERRRRPSFSRGGGIDGDAVHRLQQPARPRREQPSLTISFSSSSDAEARRTRRAWTRPIEVMQAYIKKQQPAERDARRPQTSAAWS